ncbi:TAXI family TRAP transporter solute-binding subunit [Variovorax dokdonensis]|uniref:TAXI family TRAP transporter solute-binding subunit n=1 Tax=Variovorax dokdonensis TaxID=344883 RepID=A0ABT7NDT1_9BURK|nr:TAXI family TRAP transporter solute-binding subunit [Variovorax dokdonensis]MDM0046015.1 TAXI family TRAP transporter solute-binding subunit [Variovorax dokdonensis]
MVRRALELAPHWLRWLRWIVFAALLSMLLWLVVRHVSPVPPRTLVMTTGAPDGAYQRFGERYRQILRSNGVDLVLQPSAGGLENIERLNAGSAMVGFVQGGTGILATNPEATGDASPLRALATVAYEPAWIFSRGLNLDDGLDALAGRRVAVGINGSGNLYVARELLAAYGIRQGGSEGTTFVREGGTAAAKLLIEGQVDAVIMIAAAQAPAVQLLLSEPGVRLASLAQASGLAQRHRYFEPIVLGRGAADPARDLPQENVTLLATTANLVVRDDIHPALAYLLLDAARQVHGQGTLLSRPGSFPSAKGADYMLSDAADRFFNNGRPFLQNYLPFWVAIWVQRLLLLLVPLAAIMVPLARVLPGIVTWRRLSKLYRRYGELKYLEQDLASHKLDDAERRAAHAQLDRIQDEIVHTQFPLELYDRVYTLRQHVDYVRTQLDRQAGRSQHAGDKGSFPADGSS